MFDKNRLTRLTVIICICMLALACTLERAFAAPGDLDVPCYGLFEVSFHCPDTVGNPFDPSINDVWATLIGRHGQVRIPAFWDGDGVWKARFCPENVGRYRVTLERNGVDETDNALTPTQFVCTPSDSPGFVRASPSGSAWPHFVFDNGATYFPLGMDAAWKEQGYLDYPQLFPTMSQYGMNFCRVWMTSWDGKALDWAASKASSPQPGVYSLDAAHEDDAVIESAFGSNVYVQLTLQHHGQVTRVDNPMWSDSPYNMVNPGGFLTDPNEFFTDSRAITFTKAKFRYIIARYAWCTHLLGWEVFNEIQNDTDLKEPDFIAWHQTMIDYIRSIDPYHHLITTSYTDPTEKLAQETSIDYYQPHTYPTSTGDYFREQAQITTDRPLFWGEFGAADVQTRQQLHDGLWAGIMVPVAGAPQFWYFDSVQQNNWWQEFANVATFARDSGLMTVQDSKYVPAPVATDVRAPLHLYPGLGWQNEVGDGVVTITPDGTATGMQGIPSGIQGAYHRTMMPDPLTIKTNFSSNVKMDVRISVVSASGSHLLVSIDGVPTGDWPLPGTGVDTKTSIDEIVEIPAGTHAIQILNSGLDWFILKEVDLDNVAPGADVMVRALQNRFLFWANRVDGAGDEPIAASFTVSGVKRGSYSVNNFDTQMGTVVGTPMKIESNKGNLTVPINLNGYDIAGWIVPK